MDYIIQKICMHAYKGIEIQYIYTVEYDYAVHIRVYGYVMLM